MSLKFTESESQLTASTSMLTSDFIRTVIGGTSGRIQLQKLLDSSAAYMTNTLNFVTDTNFRARANLVKVIAAYTASTSNVLINADATTAAFTIKLPTVGDMYNATTAVTFLIRVHNVTPSAGNDVTLAPNDLSPAATINGGSTYTLTSGSFPAAEVYSDGTNYFVM